MIEDRPWGYWLGEVWIDLPKQPLRLAGHVSPPFEVVRSDGRRVTVVEKPCDQST
jgi:hypothetical protein